MSTIRKIMRKDLQQFEAYCSEQIIIESEMTRLHLNELPYHKKRVDGIQLNRYPKKQPTQLIEQLAMQYGVEQSEILISRGSDDAIDLLIRLCCRAYQDGIMICPPTFGIYAICARLQGAKVCEIFLEKNQDYQLNIEEIKKNLSDYIKIIFICSPNNPTGNLINEGDIITLCEISKNKCLVVVDEAYIDFSESPGLSKKIKNFDNLVILKTLSKSFGLANLRCGILMANSEIISTLMKILPPYQPSDLMESKALRVIEKKQTIEKYIFLVKKERTLLAAKLARLKFVQKIWPSQANFLMLQCKNSKTIISTCAANGIIIRSLSQKAGLENCVRITVGTPAENKRLFEVLSSACQNYQGVI